MGCEESTSASDRQNPASVVTRCAKNCRVDAIGKEHHELPAEEAHRERGANE
jgi:hypothetical protein